MGFKDRKEFFFHSEAFSENTFRVVKFTGVMNMSSLYEFDISLISENSEIDLKLPLEHPAALIIARKDSSRFLYNGMVSCFEQLGEYDEYTFYRAVLVPRLSLAERFFGSRLFLDKKVPDVIEEVLKGAGLTAFDVKNVLKRSYPEWEYICQYNESDFNFISHWMEREGIYYYFEQTKDGDKVVLADNLAVHEPIEGGDILPFAPGSGLIPSSDEVVLDFSCRARQLPKEFHLRDYNYRKPSLEVSGRSPADSRGWGEVYHYEEHFKTPEEGKVLARIRSEEALCLEKVYYGTSTHPGICPGYTFTLENHGRSDFNRQYLVTEVFHDGVQSGANIHGIDRGMAEGDELGYSNRFAAVGADVQFRPVRITAKPRFFGTINAHVDSSGDGKYADLDEQGRYKVVLPFDLSGRGQGKASRWVRMAQPYTGANYGMHFPLHKGVEVLLTFIDGDPDRPIISLAIPNPQTTSPVTRENQTQGRIVTAGDNEITMEDTEGCQQVFLYSPTHNTTLSLGANMEGNIYLSTEGNWVKSVVGTEFHKTLDNVTKLTVGDWTLIVAGDRNKVVLFDEKSAILGEQSKFVLKDVKSVNAGKHRITALKSIGRVSLTGKISQFAAAGIKMGTAASIKAKAAFKFAVKAKNIVGKAKKNIKFEAKKNIEGKAKKDVRLFGKNKMNMVARKDLLAKSNKKIVLKCGASSIILEKDGTIELRGVKIKLKGRASVMTKSVKIESEATGKNVVKGAMTDLVASGIAKIKGALVKIN